MLFKTILLISLSVCSIYSQTTESSADAKLKEALLRRAAALDVQVKNGIQRLHEQKREHMSQLLKDEEKRLESLVKDLTETKLTDSGSLAFLENLLIEAEFRVREELNILEREAATQELVVNTARVLKKKITDEVKILETIVDTRKDVAQATIKAFNKEELRVEEIIKNLTIAQDQKTIETLEVELRAIEARIYIGLALVRNLLKPVKTTPHATATPAATTVPSGTPAVTTPTTKPVVDKKAEVEAKAKALEAKAETEIAKLTKEGKSSEADELKKEEAVLKKLITELDAAKDETEVKRIEKEVIVVELKLKTLIKEDKASDPTKAPKSTTSAAF